MTQPKSDTPHLSTREVAQILNMSEQWVRNYDSRAGVTPVRIGNDRRGGTRAYTLMDVEKLARYRDSRGNSAA